MGSVFGICLIDPFDRSTKTRALMMLIQVGAGGMFIVPCHIRRKLRRSSAEVPISGFIGL
jgi:hypothetical protein